MPIIKLKKISQSELNNMDKIRYGKIMKKTKKQRLKDGWLWNNNGWRRQDDNVIIQGKNDSSFIDPEINKDNKKRILDIIDAFVKFCLNQHNSNKKIVTLTKQKNNSVKSKCANLCCWRTKRKTKKRNTICICLKQSKGRCKKQTK
jgi:hypothetical protein